MSGKGESPDGKVRYAAVLRSMKDGEPCGDGYIFHPNGESVLFGLVDGLGHGPMAHEAAKAAVGSFAANSHLPLDLLLLKSHEDVRNTRGCVAFVGRILLNEKTLQCVSVGNVGSKFITKTRNLPVQLPGILGANLKRVEITTIPMESGDAIVLYSDGVSSRFRFEEVRSDDLGETAKKIVGQYGYSHDDASALVVTVNFEA